MGNEPTHRHSESGVGAPGVRSSFGQGIGGGISTRKPSKFGKENNAMTADLRTRDGFMDVSLYHKN